MAAALPASSGGGSADQNFSGGATGGQGTGGLLGAGAGGLLSAGAGAAVSSTVGGGGGLLSSLFGLGSLGAIFGFEHGGVVPSAAGGWAVPQLGANGTLAQLHSNEMALPENLSNFVRSSAAAGGAGSGHTFNLGPISVVDVKSVGQLFMNNGSVLVQALNQAIRNGSALRQNS